MAAINTKPQVLVIAFPVQSHINPMLEFSKCLASNDNLKVTFITTSIIKKPKFPQNCPINIVSISDGSDEIQEPKTIPTSNRFESVVTKNLNKFIDEQKGSPFPVKIIVYDSVFPWILDVAHERGFLGASFFTYSCSFPAICYHIEQGTVRFPYEVSETVSLPALPPLGVDDLPLILDQTILKLLTDQFSNLEKADFVLFNSFDMLENEIIKWMAKRWTVQTIGPPNLLHKIYDTSNSNTKSHHTVSLFEPEYEACRKWLDSQETSSIVYVSFGSILKLEEEQMQEIAHGLMMNGCNFLWVVRATEEHKLPPNFKSLASKTGLVVDWCTQTEVLVHHALACYVTHCGWNSTVEALSSGVPVVAMPHWYDQTTNAKFVEDVWQVGVRAQVGENGVFSREEIARCVREVIRGNKAKEMKANAMKWKELAEEAVANGGSSAISIKGFVSALLQV